MKHLFSILTAVFAVFAFLISCGGSEPGSIYGVVSDKATGEPIQNAGVELLPVGLKTVTGSDGSFEFMDISSGHYNLLVTKTGYSDTKSSTITVESGKQSKGDVQLEKEPAALRIVDDAKNDISGKIAFIPCPAEECIEIEWRNRRNSNTVEDLFNAVKAKA